MKKRQIFTITACAVAAVMLTCVLAIGLSGDGFQAAAAEPGPRSKQYVQYIDPEEESVDSIDVTWRDGPVTFGHSSDGKIHIIESARRPLGESDQMEVSVKSGTLTIRWDGRWFRRFFNVGWFGPEDKALQVLVPEALAQELEALDIGSVSGGISLEGFHAESLEASTVSGTIQLSSCAAQRLNASTVSGGVELDSAAAEEEMDISTTSGSITAQKASAGNLNISTISGSCRYAGEAKALNISSVSGAVEAAMSACPEDAGMESVSGELRMTLPAGAAFTAEHDSVSGDFSCDFSGESSGGRLRVGTGGGTVRMSTTSGDMSIEKAR